MVAELAILPAVPKPPDDPLHLLLDARTGWRDLAMTHIEQSLEDCSLCLSPDPVSTRSLVDEAGTFGGLEFPTGVATDTAGSIYLLDPATGKLKRFDPCECRFEEVPCTGGIGAAPRQIANPHGIGICGGSLFICDAGNRRVQVFALKGMTLRIIWGPWKLVRATSHSRVKPPAPEWNIQTEPGECGQVLPSFPADVWQPWDIAFDSHCRAFVTDNANGAVHRFDRHGRWQMAFGALSQPTHLAIDRNDRLYVVETGSSNVVVFDADGKELKRVCRRDKIASEFCPLSFTTDAKGNLYLGDLCEPKRAPSSGCRGSHPAQAASVVFDLHGNRLTPEQLKKLPIITTVFEQEGTYLSKPLDSEIYRCQWHRIVLEGDIPDGASVKVESFTAETQLDSNDLASLPTSAWGTQRAASALTTGNAWDCLITSPPGRYLYLRLTFRSNGSVTPRLTSVKVFFPRISLRRYLPAVFGENPISADFTDRMLAVFDTIFRSVETTLDNFALYLDPMSTPTKRDPKTLADFLTWLAAWMGVILDRSWDERRRRLFLGHAYLFHRLRGTLEGLRRQLLVYLGWTLTKKPKPCGCSREMPLLILEHFKLRRWLFLGEARLGEQSVLWGKRIVNRTQLGETAQVGGTQLIGTPDPVRDPFHFYAHKFSVFIPAACVRGADRRASVERLINLAKPAHTVHQLELVEPRFRIGFQAAIGFDAVVGRYPEGFTLNQQKLGRDTVLAHSAEKKGPPSLQIGTQSRIGTTTILE